MKGMLHASGVLCFSPSGLQRHPDAQEVLPQPGGQRAAGGGLGQVGQLLAHTNTCWSCCFIVVVHRPHVTSSVPPPTLTHVVVMASQVPVRGAGSGDGLRGVWGEDQPGDEKVAFSEAGFKRKSLIVVKRSHHIMRASRMMFIYIGSPSEPAASITSDVFCVLLLLQLDGGVVSLSMEEIKRVYPNVKSLVGNSVYVKASVLTKSG